MRLVTFFMETCFQIYTLKLELVSGLSPYSWGHNPGSKSTAVDSAS